MDPVQAWLGMTQSHGPSQPGGGSGRHRQMGVTGRGACVVRRTRPSHDMAVWDKKEELLGKKERSPGKRGNESMLVSCL